METNGGLKRYKSWAQLISTARCLPWMNMLDDAASTVRNRAHLVSGGAIFIRSFNRYSYY